MRLQFLEVDLISACVLGARSGKVAAGLPQVQSGRREAPCSLKRTFSGKSNAPACSRGKDSRQMLGMTVEFERSCLISGPLLFQVYLNSAVLFRVRVFVIELQTSSNTFYQISASPDLLIFPGSMPICRSIILAFITSV